MEASIDTSIGDSTYTAIDTSMDMASLQGRLA
jgi:hypothetical protein